MATGIERHPRLTMKITRLQLRRLIREEVVKIGTGDRTEFYNDPDPTDDEMALRYMSKTPYSVDRSSDILDVGERVDDDPDLDDDGYLSTPELVRMIYNMTDDVG